MINDTANYSKYIGVYYCVLTLYVSVYSSTIDPSIHPSHNSNIALLAIRTADLSCLVLTCWYFAAT